MKPRKGYYKRLDNGRYVCTVCATIYDNPWARHDAIRCCADLKPLSELAVKQTEKILEDSYHLPTPRTAKPHDGLWYMIPDIRLCL